MGDIYTECPTLENDLFIMRFVTKDDSADLLEVYSDKNALTFFNSDNCHGDNFYYSTKEKMDSIVNSDDEETSNIEKVPVGATTSKTSK